MKAAFALSLLIFACTGCQSNRLGIETQPKNREWNHISVHGKDGWHTLKDLELRARTYLLEHNTGFTNTARETTFWIEDGSTNELLMIHYDSGFGRPYWSVTIDKVGSVINTTTGILTEGPLSSGQK